MVLLTINITVSNITLNAIIIINSLLLCVLYGDKIWLAITCAKPHTVLCTLCICVCVFANLYIHICIQCTVRPYEHILFIFIDKTTITFPVHVYMNIYSCIIITQRNWISNLNKTKEAEKYAATRNCHVTVIVSKCDSSIDQIYHWIWISRRCRWRCQPHEI